jgi:hypothetical protein
MVPRRVPSPCACRWTAYSTIGRGRRAAVHRTCSSRSASILRDFNRQGAREVDPTGWRRRYVLMALPAALTASAAVLGTIIALLTATYLFDDLDPIGPSMPLMFQVCSDGVDKDRDGKPDLTQIRLLVAHRPLREVTAGHTVFWLSKPVENNLIGDHRRAERRRLALLECLAPSIEVGEVQREAGEFSSELVRAPWRLPAADRNALLLARADSEASRYAGFAEQLTKQSQSASFGCPIAARVRQLVQYSSTGLCGWTISDSGGYNAKRPYAPRAIDSDTPQRGPRQISR